MSQVHGFAASALTDPGPALDRGPGLANTSPAPPMVPPLGSHRSPWIAAFLAFVPGLGSVYNGSYARGVAFFMAVLGTIHLANRGSELFGFGVAFLWLFNVIDAYREARLIRAGWAQDLGAARLRPTSNVAEGLGLGVLLFLVGLLALLDVLGYDIDWVFNYWPIGLMLAGGWFIATAIWRMRAARTSGPAASSFDADPPSASHDRPTS
jgi:hypothetical protein